MNWKNISTEADLQEIIENSVTKPQVIFKHSTTCGISASAEYKLQKGTGLIEAKANFNYLDLLRYRPISNLIAEVLKVIHQSPQIIILKNKEVVYTSSHHAIDPQKIASYL